MTATAGPTMDYSDLWYWRYESGWGVNFIQQGETIFATLFVYGADRQPSWYVASSLRRQGEVFFGTLYRATGPALGTPFSSSPVTVLGVGNMTFRPDAGLAIGGIRGVIGSLTYVIDGITVTKTIERQSWDRDNFVGTYLAFSAGSWAGCGARDGYAEIPAVVTITQEGGQFQIREQAAGQACSYSGSFSPAGKLGIFSATGTCDDGSFRTFSGRSLRSTPTDVSMDVSYGAVVGCRFTGRMAGVRRGP